MLCCFFSDNNLKNVGSQIILQVHKSKKKESPESERMYIYKSTYNLNTVILST